MSNKKLKQKKLRDILTEIGTESDLQEVDSAVAAREAVRVRFDEIDKKLSVAPSLENLTEVATELKGAIRKTREDFINLHENMTEAYKGSIKEVIGGLDKMSGVFTGYAKDVSKNAAPVYKDMINQLSMVRKSIDDKPVPVWNWPQYASVSVRNKNFANINPAIQGFGLDDFDQVELSNYTGDNVGTVTYLLNGSVTAVLELTYVGDNLTNVIRTQ